MRSRPRQFVFLFIGVLATAALTFGQSATTSLHGTVTDPKGAVVAGAQVTISNPATGLSRATKSGDQGEYQFLELPPATYELTVKAPGFAIAKEKNIQLLVRTPGTLNVSLQVSGNVETVEVNAAANMINT